jgi:YjbE family integral membrane protein
MMEIFTAEGMSALAQVIMIDLVLAGDNAIVIGLAAAGLAPDQRGKVILIGIIAATIMRIGFALVTTQLLAIVGLLFAGGVLLLWVCWKMWRELRHQAAELKAADTVDALTVHADGTATVGGSGGHAGHGAAPVAGTDAAPPRKTFAQAAMQIVIADVSMSLDNVLAVAGAAREHPEILIFGLALSVVLMGVAASFIAKLLQKHRWIAYVGLLVILYVALDMTYRGVVEVWPYVQTWMA